MAYRSLSARPRIKRHAVMILTALLVSASCAAFGADEYTVDKKTDVIGRMSTYTIKDNESFYEVARTYKTGYNQIVAANPGVDPIVPGKGKKIILPRAWILPDGSKEPGIVINLSEMRLYYYFKEHKRTLVRTYPIGIGDLGKETPLGLFKVVEKIVNPAWHVPESIRKEKPELPAIVPPGPDNPMGSHALRLSRRTVLIHGTDMPWGIGRRVSHGCIRLYPEDIVDLFERVPLGARVAIVQQPVKAGVSKGRVYLQVSRDDDLKAYDYSRQADMLLKMKGLADMVNPDRLMRTVREKRGFPVDISLEQ
jgi:L,D-transpeptidase ErfK/SrfK